MSGPPAEVRFDATRPRRRAVLAGQAAEVYVEVDGAGQVAIPGLGVSATAEPAHARPLRRAGGADRAATRSASSPRAAPRRPRTPARSL